MQNKPSSIVIFACAVLFLITYKTFAADEAIKSGQTKAMACTACHGVENSNNPEWPNLSQQSTRYLIEQLHAFRDGIRKNALMSPQAMGLTDQDIVEIAKYYNSVPAKKGKITATDNVIELGQSIYRGGIADRGVPACMSCHGPNGLGVDRSGYPKISGQHAKYLYHVLEEYKEDYDEREERGKNFSIMSTISFKLSNKEMKALSEYLQGLY